MKIRVNKREGRVIIVVGSRTYNYLSSCRLKAKHVWQKVNSEERLELYTKAGEQLKVS